MTAFSCNGNIMPLPKLAIFSAFTLWLAVLGWYDVYYRRLPNYLTLGGAAVFLALRLWLNGWEGVINSFYGGLVGFIFLLVPYCLKGAGAGDIKMLSAVGIVVGYPFILSALTFSSVFGLVVGAAMFFTKRLDTARLRHYLKCCFCYHYDREEGRRNLPGKDSEAVRIPFGLAISLGTWTSVVLTFI